MQPSKRYVCTREILYSGTPLIWTQWGKVSVLVKCPISGVKLCVLEETVSLLQRCPYLSRVLSSMFNPNPTVFILTPLKLSLSLYRRGKELRPIPAVERLRRNWKNSNSNSNPALFLCLSLILCILYNTVHNTLGAHAQRGLHLTYLCSSHEKRYHLPNGRRRSENMQGFLWKCSVAELERFQHCMANAAGSRHLSLAVNAHVLIFSHNKWRVSTLACSLLL